MAQHVTVRFAEREFTIKPLTLRHSRAWRQAFKAQADPLLGIVAQAGEIELSQSAEMVPLLGQFGPLLIESVDILADLFFQYARLGEVDRDWIEDNGTDDELVAAFMEVLKLAYPFGQVTRLLSGPAARST